MGLFDGTLVLDGGLATELEARGHELSGGLWSARLLRDAPEEVVAAHEAFFAAGAQVATSASYQASFAGFAAQGLDRRESARLMRRSVELARRAADNSAADSSAAAPNPRLVAASVGPYGAVLADGSEFRGAYGLSHRELVEFPRPRMEVLAEAGPDVLALETVPDVDEAVAELTGKDTLLSTEITTENSSQPAGTVVRQSAQDGTSIAQGSTVTITVSSGPRPTSTPSPSPSSSHGTSNGSGQGTNGSGSNNGSGNDRGNNGNGNNNANGNDKPGNSPSPSSSPSSASPSPSPSQPR